MACNVLLQQLYRILTANVDENIKYFNFEQNIKDIYMYQTFHHKLLYGFKWELDKEKICFINVPFYKVLPCFNQSKTSYLNIYSDTKVSRRATVRIMKLNITSN